MAVLNLRLLLATLVAVCRRRRRRQKMNNEKKRINCDLSHYVIYQIIIETG